MTVDYVVEVRFSLTAENTDEVVERVRKLMCGQLPIGNIQVYSLGVSPVKVDSKLSPIQ